MVRKYQYAVPRPPAHSTAINISFAFKCADIPRILTESSVAWIAVAKRGRLGIARAS